MFGKLKEGDRVQIGGGYSMEPEWLNGKPAYIGNVISFIPGQNESPAVVVELDEEIAFREFKGKYLVLELRYVGAKWSEKETVHVELCNFVPSGESSKTRKRGEWIESHASYKKL